MANHTGMLVWPYYRGGYRGGGGGAKGALPCAFSDAFTPLMDDLNHA